MDSVGVSDSDTDVKNVTDAVPVNIETSEFWTQAKSINLAKLIQAHRCLWDPTCTNFRERYAKSNAFKNIGSILGCHPREIERKVKNVFCQYYREIKRNYETSADANRLRGRKQWFLFEHLPFLSETPYASKCISNLSVTDDDMVEFVDTDCQRTPDFNVGVASEIITVEEKQITPAGIIAVKKLKRNHNSDYQSAKITEKLVSSDDLEEDEIEIFCKLVATKLRSLRIDIRVAAELEITHLLCQKQIENLKPPE